MLLPPLPEKLHGFFEKFDAPCETLHELCKASNVQPEAIDRLFTELWEFCEDNYVLLLELSEKPRVILVCKAGLPRDYATSAEVLRKVEAAEAILRELRDGAPQPADSATGGGAGASAGEAQPQAEAAAGDDGAMDFSDDAVDEIMRAAAEVAAAAAAAADSGAAGGESGGAGARDARKRVRDILNTKAKQRRKA